MAIRPDDDDPDIYVAGRPSGREFVALPRIGVQAIRLLEDGLRVGQAESALAAGGECPDVGGLVESLAEIGFVAAIDGRALPEPDEATIPSQLEWLRAGHVRWLFSRPVVVGYVGLAAVTGLTLWRKPGLAPNYRDFFWGRSVSLVVLVNVLAFLVGGTLHELMHLAAARSVGVPARIGFGTRMTYLALQTDVSAAWTVPRRYRYRIYLAGLYWDSTVVCVALLARAYLHPGSTVDKLLAVYILAVVVGMALQAQVYMRTDLYFVLLDVLRCGNLFNDGTAWLRFGLARAARAMRLRRGPTPSDPLRDLPPRERRAVRLYTPLLVSGSAVTLAVTALYGVPILVGTIVRAVLAVVALSSGGGVAAGVDGLVVLVAEGGLQVLFFITFYRRRRAWLRSLAGRLRQGKRRAVPGTGAVEAD